MTERRITILFETMAIAILSIFYYDVHRLIDLNFYGDLLFDVVYIITSAVIIILLMIWIKYLNRRIMYMLITTADILILMVSFIIIVFGKINANFKWTSFFLVSIILLVYMINKINGVKIKR